ncbi:MAG TPA: GNAT family N-acetyltransferase [Xanthobacteraceae bacterium]|nr:GNAT family N-acetyltransferase [Xanthobacteraceae bacterium]
MAAPVYQFRRMTAADLAMVGGWLAMPHVVDWWGDADKQLDFVRQDLECLAMDQFVVAAGDRPFAYLQCYDPTAWPENGLGPHPSGTRGIDQFIGDPNMIGHGHGSAFIRQFTDGLLTAGRPRVLTDPDPANARAIRACEKAGFRAEGVVDTPDGLSLLMVRDA